MNYTPIIFINYGLWVWINICIHPRRIKNMKKFDSSENLPATAYNNSKAGE